MTVLAIKHTEDFSLKTEKILNTAYVEERLDDFLAGIEKRAFCIARIATVNDDEALDIVQDAMLRLATRYAHKSAGEWPLLFHRILKNRILDWHRQKKTRGIFKSITWHNNEDDSAGVPDAVERMDMHEPGPEKRTMFHQTIQTIETLLHSLPLRQQQAFIYRVWEEMDIRTTAKIMQCSEGSVKTHYSRAVHQLRSLLGGLHNER